MGGGTTALVKAMALGPALAAPPPGSTYQPDCTYNGAVQSCVVAAQGDSSEMADNTILVHWLDGDITSVQFLGNGSTQVGAKVILNHNKRGHITQAVPLEEGRLRLHVKSETGNRLSFILPTTINQPLPGPDPVEATALGPALAAPSPSSTYQPDCTYNGAVQSCVVAAQGDSSEMTDNTILIHWLDGDITSVWFLSNGSTQVGKVILNYNKRGRITQAVPLEEGRLRLHVKSETGNQLSFILPTAATDRPLPGPGAGAGAVPLQP